MKNGAQTTDSVNLEIARLALLRISSQKQKRRDRESKKENEREEVKKEDTKAWYETRQ